jgi:hypothetical protein
VALKDGLISPQSLPTPPKVERPDPRAYLADKRLNVKLKLVAKDPKVEEMLRALADATKLKFTAHPTLLKLQPDFGKVSFPSISASELMTVIATEFADGAYWKKTEDGYILTNPDLDGKKPGK